MLHKYNSSLNIILSLFKCQSIKYYNYSIAKKKTKYACN